MSKLQTTLQEKPTQHSTAEESQDEECHWLKAVEWEYETECGMLRTDLQGDITFLENNQTKSDPMPDSTLINTLVIYTSLGMSKQQKNS